MAKRNICERCAGTGFEPDDKIIGDSFKRQRLDKEISLRDMAARIKLSHGFLCQLEQGARRWTPEVIRRYQKELSN